MESLANSHFGFGRILLISTIFAPRPSYSLKYYTGKCDTNDVDNDGANANVSPCAASPFREEQCQKGDDMCITMTYVKFSPQNVAIGAIRQDICGNSQTDCKMYKKVPDTIGECFDKPVPPVQMINIHNGQRDTSVYKKYRGCSCGKDLCNASWKSETFPQLKTSGDVSKDSSQGKMNSGAPKGPPTGDIPPSDVSLPLALKKDATILSLTYGLMQNRSAGLNDSALTLGIFILMSVFIPYVWSV